MQIFFKHKGIVHYIGNYAYLLKFTAFYIVELKINELQCVNYLYFYNFIAYAVDSISEF